MNAAAALDHGTAGKTSAVGNTPDWTGRDWAGLKAERDGHVAIITFDNPPAHTWTVHSLAALRDLVRALDADRSVVALVITGSGPKFFSAGADLKQFAGGDKAAAHEAARRFGEAFETLSAFRGVSIAAINGYAMGGGLEVALACDLRIAEQHAQLALPEASVGLLPCAGGTQNLTRLAGEGWAKRMILLGERIYAATALRIGVGEDVVASGESLARALACDLRIAEQHAQLALPEASVGLLPCAGGTQNLTRLAGEGWAKRMILLGERIDAATALRIGVVEDVVASGESLARALAWARQAGKQSPASVAASKKLVQATRWQPHASALVAEREAFVDLFDGADQREGVAAFLEKRAPQWNPA